MGCSKTIMNVTFVCYRVVGVRNRAAAGVRNRTAAGVRNRAAVDVRNRDRS